MPTYIVKDGDCLTSIAGNHGFSDPRVIYAHPNNAGFRVRCPNPNVLLPGETLFIPERRQSEVDCATERTHRFVARLPETELRIVLLDAEREPLANARYTLTFKGERREGVTGPDGLLCEQHIAWHVREAELRLDDHSIARSLRIGDLDPHDTERGMRARLENLAYPPDEFGLQEFQSRCGVCADDEEELLRLTCARLADEHRC